MNKCFVILLLSFFVVVTSADAHAQQNEIRFGENKGQKVLNSTQKTYLEVQRQSESLEKIVSKQDEIIDLLKSEIELLKRNHDESQRLMMALVKQLAKQSKVNAKGGQGEK